MTDIFDNTILCKRCDEPMQKGELVRNGFVLRVLVCPDCEERLVHPVDEERFGRFNNLKKKEFSVKMRLVGNSYTVSIPKEIVSFMNEQKRIMDHMVRLGFEEMGRLSLDFGGIRHINRKLRS